MAFCSANNLSEAGAIDAIIHNLEDQRLIVQKEDNGIVIRGSR